MLERYGAGDLVSDALPQELIFSMNPLGGNRPTVALNFFRPGAKLSRCTNHGFVDISTSLQRQAIRVSPVRDRPRMCSAPTSRSVRFVFQDVPRLTRTRPRKAERNLCLLYTSDAADDLTR